MSVAESGRARRIGAEGARALVEALKANATVTSVDPSAMFSRSGDFVKVEYEDAAVTGGYSVGAWVWPISANRGRCLLPRLRRGSASRRCAGAGCTAESSRCPRA